MSGDIPWPNPNYWNPFQGTYMNWPAPPRVMPVMMPVPEWGGRVTIAILDHDGNLTIKTDQLSEPEEKV